MPDALLVRGLHAVDRVVHRNPLAGEDDAADRQPRRLLVEIRNRELGLVSPDAAHFGIAHEELDHVLARQQREAGFVENWMGGELPGFCLLYTSDAADERSSVDLGGRRIIKK